jgi:CheY-like chemotaxis protein
LRNRDKAKEHCVAEETILRPVEFLVVEDSPTDALLMQEALSHAKLWNNVHVVEDGEEALAFLRREGLYAHAPRPDLILLDLNLPRKDGREVLAEIKGEPTLNPTASFNLLPCPSCPWGVVTSPFCLTRMRSNRPWTSPLAVSEEDCPIQGTACGIGCWLLES